MAALLAFLVRLGGQGLWIGIQSGAFVQTLLLSIITGCINWEKQVYPLIFVFSRSVTNKLFLYTFLVSNKF